MTTRNQIVDEARTWIGTPFRHQGRLKGVGVDCVGVPIGIASAFNWGTSEIGTYGHLPADGMFQRLVEENLVRIPKENLQEGDLITFAFDREPQHIAIVTQIDPLYILHAVAQTRRCVETIADEHWQKNIRGYYRFKEIV